MVARMNEIERAIEVLKSFDCGEGKELYDAIKTTVPLLEKQIPKKPTEICENCEYKSAVKDIKLILKNFRPESMINNVYDKLCKKYNIKV